MEVSGLGDGLCAVLITRIEVLKQLPSHFKSCGACKEKRKKAVGFEGADGFLVVRDVQASPTAAVRSSRGSPD